MIPGLLHGRLLVGGPAPGIVDPPGYDGTAYFATKHGPYGASASVLFDVNSNGTWEVRKDTGVVVGLASGHWYSPTTPAIGADYEVQFAVVQTPDGFGTTSVDNPAVAFVSLGTSRTLELQADYAGTDGDSTNGFEVEVTIRLAGGAVVSVGTFNVTILVGSSGGI